MNYEEFNVLNQVLSLRQSLLKTCLTTAIIETTSFDGKPLLLPSQFRSLILKEAVKPPDRSFSYPQSDLKYKLITAMNNAFQQHKAYCNQTSSRRTSSNFNREFEEGVSSPYKQVKNEREGSRQNSTMKIEVSEDSSSSGAQSSEESSEHFSNSSSPSLGRDLNEDCSEDVENFDVGILQNANKIESKLVKKLERKSNIKKVLNLLSDHNAEDEIFNVELEMENNVYKTSTLTKQEIIEDDPLLLIYFYENRLVLKEDDDFKLQNLDEA